MLFEQRAGADAEVAAYNPRRPTTLSGIKLNACLSHRHTSICELNDTTMDQITPYPHIVKSLVGDARHSHQPTLFSICQVDPSGKCEVHEQLPNGTCRVWPELFAGRQHAELAIYLRKQEQR